MILATLIPVPSYINFRKLSISTNTLTQVLVGIASNLYMNLVITHIFMMFSFLLHKHGLALHYLDL